MWRARDRSGAIWWLVSCQIYFLDLLAAADHACGLATSKPLAFTLLSSYHRHHCHHHHYLLYFSVCCHQLLPSTINGSIRCDCLTLPSFIPFAQPRLLHLCRCLFNVTSLFLYALSAICPHSDSKQSGLATGARSVLKRADGNRIHRQQHTLENL